MKSVSLFILPFCYCTSLFAQPALEPHIWLSVLPQDSHPICSIPTYQGSFDNSGYAVGDAVHDFTLYTRDGDSVRLNDLLLTGKPVLLVTGSYTCPVFRGKIDALNDMANFYAGQIHVYVVYGVEAHPVADVSPYSGYVWTTSANQQEGILFEQPDTYGERKAIVDSMLARYAIVPQVLIDGPCNEWWTHYGPAPNNAYLISTDGSIAVKHGWFHKAPLNMWCDIDSVLGSISGNCISAGNNGTFTITLDDVDSIAYGTPGEILAVHSTLTNLSATDNVELRISKQNIIIPAGWETALCADVCYVSTVTQADITIPPAGTQPFIFYFYTTAAQDTGWAKIRFANKNNPGNLIERRYSAITKETVGVGDIAKNNFIVYPNPFSDKLSFEFALNVNSSVRLEIFSVTGQRLATLFNGEVKAAELQTFEYNPETGCDCMVIYRLQTEQGTYYGKAVMVR